MFELQGSLLDVGEDVAPGHLGPTVRRTELNHPILGAGAWVDLRPSWISGADTLFEILLADVPWHAERRQMYDREVDVPRLMSFFGEGESLPHPCLNAIRQALNRHYARELREEFVTAGLCLYRDGRDSVAWHGDRIGRGNTEDTMVAIVSLGSPRQLLLRPSGGGGATVRNNLGHGDLITMGGSCQRTWEHAVPKTARPTGPRISIQFRPRGVR